MSTPNAGNAAPLLGELLQALRDSQNALIEWAAKAADTKVARLLYRMAGERKVLADELQQSLSDATAASQTSTVLLLRELRRRILQIAAPLSGEDPSGLLKDIEQVDRLILDRYRMLLGHSLEAPLQRLLESQVTRLERSYDSLQALRERRGS